MLLPQVQRSLMSLKVIARHQGATKKTEIPMFDEWMTMRARLDEEIMDGCEPEGKEEDAPEEEELLALRKRHRLDVPHPVCVASFPVFPFLLYIFRYKLFSNIQLTL